MEIQFGELAVMPLGSLIVGVGCLFFRGEITKVNPFTVHTDSTLPFSSLLLPRNSFVSRGIVGMLATIAPILSATTFSKIVPPVVQDISVGVVAFFVRGAAKNLPVHTNIPPVPYRIKTFGGWTRSGAPIPLIQPLIVGSIYQCVLAFCKRDNLVGWVQRLNNCVSFHAAFHLSSSKGLLQLSRYFNMGGALCL